jgi:hypothetical protein
MSLCRVCFADIVWCETADGERIPLDEHEEQTSGERRFRIVETRQPRPLIEPVAADFAASAMVDHREICQQPRPT